MDNKSYKRRFFMSEIVGALAVENGVTVLSLVNLIHISAPGVQLNTIRFDLNDRDYILITKGNPYLPCPLIDRVAWESVKSTRSHALMRVSEVLSFEHFLSMLRFRFKGVGFDSLSMTLRYGGVISVSKMF
jgi:uncharacterized protein YunC (DUF1805 family)